MKSQLRIVKSDGTAITVNPKIKDVKNYLETSTPSLYRRDEFDVMFE